MDQNKKRQLQQRRLYYFAFVCQEVRDYDTDFCEEKRRSRIAGSSESPIRRRLVFARTRVRFESCRRKAHKTKRLHVFDFVIRELSNRRRD
jgi:hypothetical protein